MAKDESTKAGAIYWFYKGELRTLYPRNPHPQFDLLFAGWRDGLLHRH